MATASGTLSTVNVANTLLFSNVSKSSRAGLVKTNEEEG